MTNTPPEPDRLKIKGDPTLGHLRFDPEGLLPFDMPTIEEHRDEVDKANTLIINELTDEQFEILSQGIFAAMRAEKQSLAGKIAVRAILLAGTMIILAAAVRAIVWILSGVAVQ